MRLGDLVCVYFEDELLPGFIDHIYKRTFRVRIAPTRSLLFNSESLVYAGKSRLKPKLVPLDMLELFKARIHVVHALKAILKNIDKNTNTQQLQLLLLFLYNDPSQATEIRTIYRNYERYATAFCAAVQKAPRRTKNRLKATLTAIAPDNYKNNEAYIRYFKSTINSKILTGNAPNVYNLN